MADAPVVLSVKINENSKCAAINCNENVANGVICVLCSATYHSKCAISAGNPNVDEKRTFWTCVKCVPNMDAAKKIVELLHTTTSLYRENCIYKEFMNELEGKIGLMRVKIAGDTDSAKTKTTVTEEDSSRKNPNSEKLEIRKESTHKSTEQIDENSFQVKENISDKGNKNDDKRKIKRRFQLRQSPYGTAEAQINETQSTSDSSFFSETSFASTSGEAWLFIGGATKNSTVEGLQNYLTKKCPNVEFKVEKLSDESNSETNSFKVGFDSDLLDELSIADFWPSGLLVRRYNVFEQN
ncbi:hypothetical protein Zmor_006969 [Zophobas morio]|uniref:Uncharacterized protein n=1 Tax=Zophobas morio TaxID=2755281 RepID=A0AA38MLT6_9CUCU|nr:hypothetical protein Zmor_006969 [Zophobas morio]